MIIPDYTVVIPSYCCYVELRQCVADILQITPEKYLPSRVIIVDDGSPDDTQYVAPVLSTALLPVDSFSLDGHSGFPVAVDYGLSRVDTDYAVILHADTRLVCKMKYLYRQTVKAIEDPLGVIMTYLSTSDKEVVAVAPFSVVEATPHKIYGGIRMLSTNNVPYSRFRGTFYEPIRNIPIYEWTAVHSVDHLCVAICMRTYKQFPLTDEFGHFFSFDDWCCRVRKAGNYVYITSDAVVAHPIKDEKPHGSFAVPLEENYTIHLNRFNDKWLSTPSWDPNSASKNLIIEEIVHQNE